MSIPAQARKIACLQYPSTFVCQTMPELFPDFFILAIASFVAGLIDAVVGGGGLIQIPALFAMLPNTTPATIFGTNKLAGIFGTSAAAINFAKRVKLAWSAALPR